MKLNELMKVVPNEQKVTIYDDNGTSYAGNEKIGEIRWEAVAPVVDAKVNCIITGDTGDTIAVEVHQS